MLAKLFVADTPPRRICKGSGGFPEHFRALFFSIRQLQYDIRGRGNATSYPGSGVLKLPSQSHRRQRYRCTGRHRLLSRSIKRRRTRRTSCPQFGHWRFSEIECGSPSRRSSNGIPKHATPFAGRAVSRQALHTACKSGAATFTASF